MVIQNFIFPSVETSTEEELYFRTVGEVEYTLSQNKILLKEKACLYFDTYFNSLSIGKWKKYTKVKHVFVNLKIKGKAKIRLIRKERIGEEVQSHFLNESILESAGEEVTLKFEDSNTNGIYSVDIVALEDTEFYGGFYWTDQDADRFAKIALNICTFRREKFVEKNMGLIEEKLWGIDFCSNYKIFRKNLHIFLIDNASTLEKNKFNTDYIYLIQNKNVGGAGGFTRGLIEIKKLQKEEGYTHALLMDDDIVIEVESLFRTWVLLSLLKEEYKKAFIGGAMLRLDKAYIQVESGALWDRGYLVSRKSGLDLRSVEACLYNETEEKVDYCAWWYCAVPLEIVTENNLPLPIFIRGDDVEYGLRNIKKVILMNGICVWHEPFENKYSSSMFYYILRNRLIDNAIHHIALDKKEFIKVMEKQVRVELYLYRYKNARLLMRGVMDFYKGIDWLKEQDGEKLHKWIMNEGYKMQYIEELEEGFDYPSYKNALGEKVKTSLGHRIIRRVTINGTFLKPKCKVAVTSVADGKHSNVYRAEKVINYDKVSQKGFITKRDVKEAKACERLLKRVIAATNQYYDKVNEEYAERGKELMQSEFWKHYLGIL